MADLKISELAALAGANLAAGDLLPIVDVSASETKKITVTDLVGNATTLIADATIPGAKILFGAGTIAGSAIAAGGVGATQLADDAVTAAKLANESTVDLVTTLPGSGAFTGQLALDTDDLKVYCWDGSSWQSIKAAGSVNSVVGSTAGIINVSVSTSGDTVTISTTLDNTSAAAQFLAGPSNAAGAATYRAIVGADLPTATSSTKGAVQVNGNGLTLSGDTLAINNTVTANTSAYHLTQYDGKGLVTTGRAITGADLPLATSGSVGAIRPDSDLTVNGTGTLSHTNAVTAGTATKVTYNAQGHITAGTTLVAADIPELPASKITSGTFTASQYGTNSITGNKLANSSTVLFGGAGSTSGVVTFPTAEFKGQYFWDELNGDLYIWSGSAWLPVTITSGELVYAGTYDASVNQVASVTSAGSAVGLTVAAALPAASATNNRYYVVVSDSGTGSGNAPAEALAPPDMILSNGATWDLIDVSSAIAGQAASNISFTPFGGIAATNVQTALQELDSEKLPKAGGTMTGALEIGTTGSLVFEGSTANDFETTLTVVDPTADRTITLPDATGTLVTTGDTGSVTSTMIANGTIVDADINASAAIADTKLAAISTADKVSLSALNIDGGTDIGAALADVDLFIVDDGGSGTNRTAAATRITDYAFGKVSGDITITSGGTAAIGSGVIVNADVNASAAIAGTKISPDFGSQDIATTGRAAVGGTGRAVGGAVVPALAIETLGQAMACVRNSADTSGGIIALGKSRGTATGGVTAVQLDDILGEIRFAGANGTDMSSIGAHIRALVDGEVGTAGDLTDMPTRLVFSTTPNGEATAAERMRIDQAGRVGIDVTPATNTKLDLNGTYAQNIVAVPSLNIDCATGNYFTKTINGASTFTVSNVPASRAYAFTLELTHTSGAITWFSGVEWPSSTAPTLTTGKTHLFMFVTDDGGTRWRASSLINYTN